VQSTDAVEAPPELDELDPEELDPEELEPDELVPEVLEAVVPETVWPSQPDNAAAIAAQSIAALTGLDIEALT